MLVPQVYALYSDPETGTNNIVMEYIQGKTLASLWPDLDFAHKGSIMATLRSSLDELRRMPSPGYYGSLDARGLLDEAFGTTEADPAMTGPFTSEAELNVSLAQNPIE
ncbi:hypothetical protein BJX76DRAFT_362490 [Aspergillus varians]